MKVDQKTTRDSLNEQIALYLGWTCEADYHNDSEEWEGWRDPKGECYSNVPNFLKILQHFLPALEGVLDDDEI